MISCGHCGGHHSTVAEVRSCAGDMPPAPADPVEAPWPGSESHQSAAPVAETPDVALDPGWDRLAGPAALGRGLLVRSDAEARGPWADAPRLHISLDDAGSIAKLAAARTRRERLVAEFDEELPSASPRLDTPYWNLAPDTELGHERLRHLLLANNIDARDPARPTFLPVSRAVAAGASVAGGDVGDVVVGGSPRWCDGGPLDWPTDLGAPLIPAVHLARGSLATLRDASPEAELAPDQLEAVAHRGGGARIIAPAGSGKTRVLTERARHLVRDRGVDPQTICLVAFNVRAREQMEQRTADLEGLEVRTLNSLALAILSGRGPFRTPAARRPPRVIDERDVRRVLADLVTRRRQAMSDPFAVWLEALTASRLGLRSPAAVEREFGGDVKGFADVLPAFREHLRHQSVVDFDEQILGAIEVLCTDPEARATARRACGVLLVDEFQDLTPAHVLLVRLLAGPEADVFGVGDDDQTIYGYAGASPEWLIDFADLFPGSAPHDLRVNYRCPPEVVEAAATLLTHNRRRIDKEIEARPGRARGADGGPAPLEVAVVAEPLATTVDRVQELIGAGAAPQDIAILTRVNATLLGPMLALGDAGIPTNAPVEASFLERTGVAGALAWIRLATAPELRLRADDISVAVRRPPRGLRPMIIDWMGEQSSPLGLTRLADRLREQRDADKVTGFVADVAEMRGLADDGATTADLLAAVRDRVGLGAALENRLDASRRSVDRSAHGDDLAAMLAIAGYEPDPARFGEWLAHRLGEATPDWQGVRLSTVHRVKGREWPHVIVHEATAGLFPHRLAADREEERRVFHVAITRGAERVLVVAGSPSSPFIAELDDPRDPSTEPEPEAEPQARAPEPSADDLDLRDRLKAWRLATSQEADVPAYVVFNNATLDDLIIRRPTTPDELLDVAGIGPVKVERYGEAILTMVASDDL